LLTKDRNYQTEST